MGPVPAGARHAGLAVMARDLARTEVTIDGHLAPVWMAGDDEHAERLQVDVVWVPILVINGEKVEPFGLGPEPLPQVSVTTMVYRRAIQANRERVVEDELAKLAEAAADVYPALLEVTRSYLSSMLRLCLARRGFPVP